MPYNLIAILFFLLLSYQSSGQEITGKVTDQFGNVLPGASIYAYGENRKLITGSSAEKDGTFIIKKAEEVKEIKVSYIGYKAKTKKVQGSEKVYTFKLKQSKGLLGNITVKAYPYHYFSAQQNNILTLKGDHPGLAATFDDPSIALLRSPGVSLATDQNNAISYHGLAPNMIQWEMNSAEIVNPNHLANAGTTSDVGSIVSGGVHSIPFHFQEEFKFYASPLAINKGNALAGISEINPLRSFEDRSSFLKIGLLGLEVAYNYAKTPDDEEKKSIFRIKKKEKDETKRLLNLHGLYAYYRYSTVGLLAQLGADFNGEKINFQDAGLSAQLISNKKQKLYFSLNLARSFNIHEPVSDPTDENNYLDILDNKYNNDILISGLNHRWKGKKGLELRQSLFFSMKDENKESFFTLPNSPNIKLDDFEFNYQKLSYTIHRSKRFLGLFKYYLGANASYHLSDLTIDVLSNNNQESFDFYNARPYAGAKFNLFFVEMDGGIGTQYNSLYNDLPIDYYFGTGLKFRGFEFRFDVANQSQLYHPIQLLNIRNANHDYDLTSLKSQMSANRSFSLSYSPKKIDRLFKVTLRSYSSNLRNIANIDGFSFHNGNQFVLANDDGSVEFTDPKINGVDVQLDCEIINFWFLNANFNSILSEPKEDIFHAFDYGYIFNAMLTRQWNIRNDRRLFFNLAFHAREGAPQRNIDTNASNIGETRYLDQTNDDINTWFSRLEDMQRLDLRLRFDFGFDLKNSLQFDLRNVLNQKNEAYSFYDWYSSEIKTQYMQGLIPLFSYTRKF